MGFLGLVENWLWPLREEVRRLHELGLLLKNIGCFHPRQSLPSVVVQPRSRAVPVDADTPSASSLATAVATDGSSLELTGEGNNVTIVSGNNAGAQSDVSLKAKGGERADVGAPLDGSSCGNFGSYDFRGVENKVQEGLEGLGFHLTVLQRSVDQAHINMRIASQEFSSLLKKARG